MNLNEWKLPLMRASTYLRNLSWQKTPPSAVMLTFMGFAVLAAILVAQCGKERVLPPSAPEAVSGEVVPAAPPIPEVEIEVNIPATELTLFEKGIPLFHRKVAIGRGIYPTPEQETEITRIEWNPWWYPPKAPWAAGAKPTPPGPSNPLGLVKMPLSREILFHGTNQEWSVGRPASQGCMRMNNSEVVDMAWFLQERFSDLKDPSLRDLYRKNRGTTYVVQLLEPVPVHIIYRPIVIRDDAIMLYPDHYGRLGGRRAAGLVTALLAAGYDLACLNKASIDGLAKRWPIDEVIPITDLLNEKTSHMKDGLQCE
jgi:hypothetical protein